MRVTDWLGEEHLPDDAVEQPVAELAEGTPASFESTPVRRKSPMSMCAR
jgi:hypothetical protein